MIKRIKKNKGFVLLFAVTLAAVFLSIAIGVTEVALKEVQFSTSAKNTNNAFFAADTGVECALYYDRSGGSSSVFIDPSTGFTISCNNKTITVTETATNVWNFSIPNLGGPGDGTGTGCAVVKVDKSNPTPPPGTTITADGYNAGTSGANCNPPSTAVDRELSTSY